MSYGYISGEHITGFDEGRPLFVRSSDSNFTLANFVRAHLFSALCALRTGLNVLFDQEQVELDELRGHGGFFKTKDVGQRIMAAAMNVPVSVMETAAEGEIAAMIAALVDLRKRVERAGREASQFTVEVRCSEAAAIQTTDDSFSAVSDTWLSERSLWKSVEIVPLVQAI